MIMRNLAAHVVQDVRFADAMQQVRTDRTQPVAVHGAKSTTGKVPRRGIVMREQGVRVLQVGDHHQPVVRPKIRNEVVLSDLFPAAGREMTPSNERTQHKSDANVRHDDLVAVALLKDHRIGREV